MAMDALNVNKIGKTIDKKRVVREVSLAVERGQIIGLLGPNGAGKTTTFYMICGLIKPDIGNVCIDNEDITRLPIYQKAKLGLAYLPQEASIFRGLNVEDNIKAILEVSYPASQIESKLEELCAEFGISHLRKSSSVALSGGERRRVEMARCLAANPKFILLDEPFAGVDPIAVGDIQKYILKLKEKKIGVLITDHNVRETLKITDKAYIIHEGMVLAAGLPREIAHNKAVRSIYLGEEFSLN